MADYIVDPVTISTPPLPPASVPPPAPKPSSSSSWWSDFAKGVAGAFAGKLVGEQQPQYPYYPTQPASSMIPGIPNWLLLGGAAVGIVLLLKRKS